MKVTVEAMVKAPLEVAWDAWNSPEDIMQWNAASDDWHTPSSQVDLRVGGRMSSRMEAKDGSRGFDFAAEFIRVEVPTRVTSRLDDGRELDVVFEATDDGVRIVETFDADTENDIDMQRAGWQAILDRFAAYVENKTS